jgi:hypothetical protein
MFESLASIPSARSEASWRRWWRRLGHIREKLLGFFDQDMLQLFEFAGSTPEYGKQNNNGDWHT